MAKTCVIFPVWHARIYTYNNSVYFARDIVNLDSEAFKEVSKEAQKLCHIVLCALIWKSMSEKEKEIFTLELICVEKL